MTAEQEQALSEIRAGLAGGELLTYGSPLDVHAVSVFVYADDDDYECGRFTRRIAVWPDGRLA